nr:M23 family metallopeptidase [Thalassobacillus sp. CUG 92003]
MVGDETLGYFKDRKQAKKALFKYKATFADADKLRAYEQAENEARTPKTGSTIVADVSLSEEVTISGTTVHPGKIISVKDGVNRLDDDKEVKTTHKVKKDDTMDKVLEQYDLSQTKLEDLNESLDGEKKLKAGQSLTVTTEEPVLEVTVKEVTSETKTVEHDKKVVESDSLYKGEQEVKQAGKDGKKEIHSYVRTVNGKQDGQGTMKKMTIDEPVKEIIRKGTKEKPSRGSGDLGWPAEGGSVTSKQGERWGALHKGIDIAGVSDRTIKAADNGVVKSVESGGGYGNKIVINHNNGYKTVYAHLASTDVSTGETVSRGSSIGTMGSTGDSTGIHLHFEVYKNGSLVNPMTFY